MCVYSKCISYAYHIYIYTYHIHTYIYILYTYIYIYTYAYLTYHIYIYISTHDKHLDSGVEHTYPIENVMGYEWIDIMACFFVLRGGEEFLKHI